MATNDDDLNKANHLVGDMAAQRDAAQAEVERLLRDLKRHQDRIDKQTGRLMTERDAAQAEVERLRSDSATVDRACAIAVGKLEKVEAEAERLRRVVDAARAWEARMTEENSWELQRVVRALDTPAQPEPDYSDCEHYSDCTAWPGAICPTSCDGCDGEYPPRDDAAQPEPQEERRCGTCRDWCGHYCKHPFTKTTPETESDGTTCPDWTRKEERRCGTCGHGDFLNPICGDPGWIGCDIIGDVKAATPACPDWTRKEVDRG